MDSRVKSLILVFIIDLLIIILSSLGIYRIYNKADLPIKFQQLDSTLVVKDNYSAQVKISPGDTLLSINGKHFSSQDEIEVYIDRYTSGSFVHVEYFKNGNIVSSEVELIKFYSAFYIITASVAGLLLILIGLFIILKKPGYKPARVIHWVNTATASIIMMTWGNYNFPPNWIDQLLNIIFSICYSFAPAAFVHFTLIFPREKKISKTILFSLYLSAIIVSAFSSIFFLRAISSPETTSIKQYLLIFDLSRIYMAGCIVSGLVIFIHSYITSENLSERIKIRWILLGFVLGPLLFASLWVIPQAITNYGLVPEEFVLIFMLFIPITFAIAILKHHAFDIDLIIKRSLLYFFSLGFLIIVYAFVVAALSEFAKNVSELLSSGIAVIIIALLFNPAKDKVEKFIDKKFFKVKYDFRIASRKFLDEIKNCNDIQSLAEHIMKQIKILIPVQKQGFFLFNRLNSRVYLKAGDNFDILKGRSIFLDQQKLKTTLPQPVALKDKIEPGSPIEEADIDVFKRWQIVLIFPIKSSADEFLGFLVLGEKKSGSRFTVEDLDLLIEVCMQAGLSVERINIQEKLIREQLLKDKLQELSDLKSFFLSSVSHELKTPLTSIRMFSEFLESDQNLKPVDKNEYLEIIQGECDRLGRLIENVLDLSKIERGVKEYHFAEIDIKSLVEHCIALMSYQLKMEQCELITKICDDDYVLCGDPDLIKSAVINLLSNGIKYSSIPKKIFVTLENDESSLNIKFENNSSCLSKDELLIITKPYYRSENVKVRKIPGSGIGLALVEEIMRIHKGKLLINTISNSGYIFTLSFPKEN